MPRILTLTLNPALDLVSETERLAPERKTRCAAPRRTAGGGGINVARGVHALGGEVLALHTSGGPVGELMERLLAEEGLPAGAIPIAGDIRQNLAIADRERDEMLHLVFPGPRLAEDEWRACAEAVLGARPAPDYLVLSGSLPPGVPEDFYAELATRATQAGMRVLLDTTGPPLEAALEARVPLFLAKPNRREFRQLAGLEQPGPADYLAAMESLLEDRAARALVVTLGSDGALLAAEDGQRLHLHPPPTPGRAPVGAGDTFVAALVHRLVAGDELPDACRVGVAAAAAAVRSREPGLADPRDVQEALREVRVDDLAAR